MGCQVYTVLLRQTPWAIARFVKGFRQVLKKNRYDIVHCHGSLFDGSICPTGGNHWSSDPNCACPLQRGQ